MEKDIETAIGKTAKRILRILIDQIYKDTFTTPNTWYDRSNDFERAWTLEPIKNVAGRISTLLFFDRGMVKWDGDWKHGNPKEPARFLEDILNLAWNDYSPGYTSSMKYRSGGGYFSHKRRPYWENFIKNIFDKGQLSKIMKEELLAVGLKVI